MQLKTNPWGSRYECRLHLTSNDYYFQGLKLNAENTCRKKLTEMLTSSTPCKAEQWLPFWTLVLYGNLHILVWLKPSHSHILQWNMHCNWNWVVIQRFMVETGTYIGIYRTLNEGILQDGSSYSSISALTWNVPKDYLTIHSVPMSKQWHK